MRLFFFTALVVFIASCQSDLEVNEPYLKTTSSSGLIINNGSGLYLDTYDISSSDAYSITFNFNSGDYPDRIYPFVDSDGSFRYNLLKGMGTYLFEAPFKRTGTHTIKYYWKSDDGPCSRGLSEPVFIRITIVDSRF